MPSFHSQVLLRQLPLTPPEHYGAYQENLAGGFQHSAFLSTSQCAIPSRHERPRSEGLEYSQDHAQFTTVPPPRLAYANENDRPSAANPSVSSGNAVSTYSAASVPLLPPIRAPPHREEYHQVPTKRTHPAPQPKEDKPVGGVATHLDYKMEQMADFVAEMAQGMYALYESRICLADIDIIRSVNPNAMVPSAFRKYVLQVLSSTRLPSSTILLGLHYLATRMTMLSAHGRYTTGGGQVYRMLITSLLLGSKFLDDNTFQNRSWSEVSNIPVGELNVLEIEWLLAVNWNMHITTDDPQGFMVWLKHWERWQVKKVEVSMESLKLTPLDPNVQRQRSVNKTFSPVPLYPPSYNEAMFGAPVKEHQQSIWQSSRYEPWSPFRSKTEDSPPSAPETGPNTPDWFSHMSTSLGYASGSHQYNTRPVPLPSLGLPQSAPQATHNTPYTLQHPPNGWNSHGVHCACHYCVSYHDHFFMAPGYGPQPVAG